MEKFWDWEEDKLNTKLDADFKEMERPIKVRQQKYIKWYKLYNGIIKPEDMREYGANLFINYTMPTIDTLVSRVLQTLFRQRPYVVIDPKRQQYRENAKFMQSLVEDQLDNKISIVLKWYELLIETFLYGTSLPYTDWKLEKKSVKQWAELKIPGTNIVIARVPQKKELRVYDAPTYEITDIFNVYVPTAAKNIKEADGMAIKTYITPAELKKRADMGIYKNIEELSDESNPFEEIEKIRQEQQGTSDSSSQKRIKLITFYYDDRIITQANGKKIIQNKENPLFSMEKPFDRVMWHPMPNEFWGKSLADAVESLQLELNTTRNQRIDNVSLVLNKLFKYKKDSDIDPNQIISKPGHAIPVDEMNNLDTFDIGDVTSSAYQEEGIIKQDIQYITFVNDYAMGRTTPGTNDETATAVRNKTDASNINFNTVTMMLNETGLKPLYDKIIKLNMQYMDKPENVSVDTPNGTETTEITRQMISGDYGLKSANPNFELPASKEVKRQDLGYLFDSFTKNPAAATYINVPAFMKKMFALYDINDSDELLIQQAVPDPGAQNEEENLQALGNLNNEQIPQEAGVEQNGYG
jgi:hypothetical protein